MINLHYAELKNRCDIPVIEFNSLDALKFWLLDVFSENASKKKVYLFTRDCENEDIHISEYSNMPYNIIEYYQYRERLIIDNVENFFLQEYPSFEDAYRVAIDMKESNPLCYDNSHNYN